MNNNTSFDMNQEPIVIAAMDYMKDAHRNHALKPDPELGGHRRKYSKEHYEVHPIEVAEFVSHTIHADAITISVALLHDVLEDTYKTEEQMFEYFSNQFGEDIARAVVDGVLEVTDISKPEDGNRAFRKNMDKEHAWNASPERQTVKLADIKSNMPSIVKHDSGFAKKWVKEKRDVLPGLTKGDQRLWNEVNKMIEGFFKR